MKNLSPEEAIAILNDMKIDIPVPKAAVTQKKRNVALDMAISAMSCSEIPNSSDCISRQAAIATAVRAAVDWHKLANPQYSIAYCIGEAMRQLPPAQPEIVRCKDCKHFEYDHVENVNGIPLIVAHEICMRWGDGVKTSENGYCFLAERREVTDGNHN